MVKNVRIRENVGFFVPVLKRESPKKSPQFVPADDVVPD